MMTVHLLGREIRVVILNDSEFKDRAREARVFENDLQGWFDHETLTVIVSSRLSFEQQERVIIHELTHALFYMTGLNYILSTKQEEAVCSSIENFLPLMDLKLLKSEVN